MLAELNLKDEEEELEGEAQPLAPRDIDGVKSYTNVATEEDMEAPTATDL